MGGCVVITQHKSPIRKLQFVVVDQLHQRLMRKSGKISG
jgi:hypothetical protein